MKLTGNDRNRDSVQSDQTVSDHPSVTSNSSENLVRDAETQTSNFDTFVHLLKGNIGTGILAMPDAFRNAGLFMGTFSTIILGAVCTHCMHMLVNSSRLLCNKYRISHLDYADVAYKAFETPSGPQYQAKFFKALVNTFLCITQFGFCCVYFVFVAANIHDVVKHTLPNLKLFWYFCLILIAIVPLCLIRNLKLLSSTSQIATTMTLAGLGITLFYVFQSLPSISTVNYFTRWSDLPVYFGTAIFAFEGIGMVLPLQNNMMTPEDFRGYYGVLNISMIFVTVMYTTIGFFGYVKYGECSILGSITLNLPQDDNLAICVRLFMALSILFSYPLQFYVPMAIIWPFVKSFIPSEDMYDTYETVVRIALVLFTYILAVLVPNLTDVISFFGAFSSSILALIVPPIIELATIDLDELTVDNKKLIRLKDKVIIALGSIGFVFGVYATSINILYKNQHSIEIYNCTHIL